MHLFRLNLVFCFLFCFGCTALTEKTGQILEGNALRETVTERYETADKSILLERIRYKNNSEEWRLSLKAWPTLKFFFIEDENPETFILVSYSFLSPGISDWNEFVYDMTGEAPITRNENTIAIRVFSIEPIGINNGRLRQGEKRISGSEALNILRNRRDRIIALTDWMHDYYEKINSETLSGQKAFERYWKPVLFPEMVLSKRRPQGWLLADDPEIRSENINWNTGYTGRVFPEELHEVRNTGTLFRDWEEALSWIYLEYEWENITVLLSQDIILYKK